MVKRKKNPDAPRGAMGAYMFFCKSQRQRVKVSRVSFVVARWW